jgi:hypothetical protein
MMRDLQWPFGALSFYQIYFRLAMGHLTSQAILEPKVLDTSPLP